MTLDFYFKTQNCDLETGYGHYGSKPGKQTIYGYHNPHGTDELSKALRGEFGMFVASDVRLKDTNGNLLQNEIAKLSADIITYELKEEIEKVLSNTQDLGRSTKAVPFETQEQLGEPITNSLVAYCNDYSTLEIMQLNKRKQQPYLEIPYGVNASAFVHLKTNEGNLYERKK